MEEICEKLKRGNINANCFCKEHDPNLFHKNIKSDQKNAMQHKENCPISKIIMVDLKDICTCSGKENKFCKCGNEQKLSIAGYCVRCGRMPEKEERCVHVFDENYYEGKKCIKCGICHQEPKKECGQCGTELNHAHGYTLTPEEPQDWIVRFDNNFHIGGEMSAKPEEVKSFIADLLERERERIIGEIEKEVDRLYDKRGPGDHGSGEAYAYMTVQEILDNYKK